jgi:hypothetical protein
LKQNNAFGSQVFFFLDNGVQGFNFLLCIY